MTTSTSKNKPERKGKKEDRKSEKKYFDVFFYHDWCKSCGICMAFCPRNIIKDDKGGKPFMIDADRCMGCRFCELHCPDFAITVTDRKPRRRKGDV